MPSTLGINYTNFALYYSTLAAEKRSQVIRAIRDVTNVIGHQGRLSMLRRMASKESDTQETTNRSSNMAVQSEAPPRDVAMTTDFTLQTDKKQKKSAKSQEPELPAPAAIGIRDDTNKQILRVFRETNEMLQELDDRSEALLQQMSLVSHMILNLAVMVIPQAPEQPCTVLELVDEGEKISIECTEGNYINF